MHLFTYGTLMDPAVWRRVAREECVRERAVLYGYEARLLRGVEFPGLVEADGAMTPGIVWRDVSAEALARLDAYEGDCYVRTPVGVVLDDGSVLTADVYLVVANRRAMVLPERWVPPA